MKNTIRPMRFASAFLALALFASCDKPETTEPDPDAPGTETPDGPTYAFPYPETENTFVVDGEETTVGSAFQFTSSGKKWFVATPAECETYLDALSGDYEFIEFQMLPSLYNQDVDIKANNITLYVYSFESDTDIITSDMLESGSIRVNYEEGADTYTLLVYMKFNDGTEVGVNATAIAEASIGEITINGETNPIRAAFYDAMDFDGLNLTYLYITPSDIEYASELDEKATSYLTVVLDENDLTGDEIDITTTDKYFYIEYVDNETGNYQYTMIGDLDNATGKISIKRDESDPTKFTAKINVKFGDNTEVTVNLDGVCKSYNEVAPDPNEFTCNGATEEIKSILVDKSDTDIWYIYLTATPGLTEVQEFVSDWAFKITAPAEAFNAGEGVGFSTYKDTLKFEYEGQTWAYDPNDDTVRGTLEVYLEGDQLTLDFTTYGDVIGHYEGTAIIVE